MTGLVTVFGGGGFVGRHTVRALARKGYRIRVAVRTPHHVPELRVMGDVGQIELVQANIRNADSVARALQGADAVVNLVGVLYQSGKQTFDALQAEGAGLIARLAAERGISRFIQVSAIGASSASPSKYARSKAAGEAAVRASLPSAVIVRQSIVFGPEDDFFNRFAAMAAMSPVLPLIGGGETKFQPVYVADVAAAITAALGDPASAGKTYELGGPTVYSFRQLMELIVAETGRKNTLIPLPFAVASLIGLVGDVQAAVLPIPPMLTTDQVLLLKSDNVVAEGAAGLAALGVAATPVESMVPSYLWRFRSGGQFAEATSSAN
jgi:NADH dehydrogenase